MKKTLILKAAILPLLALAILVLAMQPPHKNNKDQQDKGQRGRGNQEQSRGNDRGQGNRTEKPGKQDDRPGRSPQQNGREGNPANNQGKGKGENMRGNNNSDNKFKGGKPSRDIIRGWDWNNDEINWGFDNWGTRKRPGGAKKVTICHHTGSDNYPVTISVSENALNAHLNHGDEIGNCNLNYSDWWGPGYIRSREQVYNVYEQTWENVSYGEALLGYALERLLGARNDLERNRSRYTPVQVERRELLIRNLETDTRLLETRLGTTRQRLNGVNITIQL